MIRCKGYAKSGKPCRMPAGSDGWCFKHRPGAEAEALRLAATSAGGSVGKARTLSPDEVEVRFESAQDVTGLLASICQWVLTGAIDPKVANAATYTASAALRGLDAGEFEERLRALEEAQGLRRAS